MTAFVIDTDVCIDALRGVEGAVDAIAEAASAGRVTVAAASVHELWEGAAGSRHREEAGEEVARFLRAFEVIAYDATVARVGGELAADLARKGRGIGDMDTMIAATALAAGATLVTRNARHFKRVPKLVVRGI